ncbi:MAG: restriction endonuclease subunit S [Chitinophagaceae bacterium]|nr:restriction endonuclease subunit S [Chitinophagaceae bacterium]
MTAKQHVPELRFPEFEGEWEQIKIGKLLSYIKGFAFKSADYCEDGERIIRVSDLGADKIKQTGTKVYISLELSKKYNQYRLINGDIIITTVGSKPNLIESAVGRAIYVDSDSEGILNQNMLKFYPKDENNTKFLHGYLGSKRYWDYIISIQRGNANQSNITVQDLLEYRVFRTKPVEQQKIAAFLTAVDDKIQLLTRKKALLEQYKKGVMQQLFSQQLRFKDDAGNDFPDWEEVRLGDLGENIIGLTYSPSNVTRDGSGVIVLRSSNIKNDRLILDDIVRVNSKIKDKLQVRDKDILICTRNGSQRLIGKNILIENFENGPFTFGAFMSVFRSPINHFLSHLFKTDEFKDQVQLNLGARINQITTGVLNEFTFIIPASNKEQQKIASFLSAIDEKINQVSTQLQHTQQYKKGLLQKMFV